ncbi:hypothetical protein TNCV_3906991 [Trichonephila clavipes]|nr:hypothetical protein TNCV_3906991 [Trichonephila clavipes]
MALYRSPLTVTLWPSSFLRKYGPMITPAHNAPPNTRLDLAHNYSMIGQNWVAGYHGEHGSRSNPSSPVEYVHRLPDIGSKYWVGELGS